MATEPSADAVDEFSGITGILNPEATNWMKAYSNDLNRAVNAYFEDPNSLQKQFNQNVWDESQFHSDQPENAQQGQNQRCEDPWQEFWNDKEAFTVHAQDSLNPSVFTDDRVGAPSRPPSRDSERRAELTMEHEVGSNKGHLTVAHQEAQQLEQAMAMSVSQTLPGQESGVIERSKTYFGPAKREYYDNTNWMMTFPAHAQEILLNPDPMERKRGAKTPAFLKPSLAGHRLPALIKILHSIPISREALLNRGHTLLEYGHDDEWWDGVQIKLPRIVNIAQEGRSAEGDEVINEAQRIMAFLDETERAYGSTDVVTNLDGIRGQGNSLMIARFLEQWHLATCRVNPNSTLANIFISEGTKLTHYDEEVADVPKFYSLELNIDEEIAGTEQSLYEAFDDILWSGSSESDFEEVFLQTIGDVFIIEASRQNEAATGLGIQIPAVWYLDRYLPSSKQQAKEMQASKIAIRKELDAIDKSVVRISEYRPSATHTKVMDGPQLLKTATSCLEKTLSNMNISADSKQAKDTTSEMSNSDTYTLVIRDLKALSARVEEKLKNLGKMKAKAREKLRELSQLYTSPSKVPGQPPHHKYTLRGVSALPHIVYVLERSEPVDAEDLMDADVEEWQWWKMSYDRSETRQPVSCTRVSEVEVLTAAQEQSRTALLVYASDRAVSYKADELSSQLRNFVRADNLSFAAELDRSASPKPASPSKRKADDEDDESLGPKLYRSSPHGDGQQNYQAAGSSDPALPFFSRSSSPPIGLGQISDINNRKAGSGATYDNVIPTSLRTSGPTVDSTSMTLDEEEGGQEMQDKDGRTGLFLTRGHKQKYTLGTYVPEIMMEDQEEEDYEGGKHIDLTGDS